MSSHKPLTAFNLQLEAVEQMKRKRMLSNRESARRSRLRKQKHLDELTAQVSRLRMENSQILAALQVTRDHYVEVAFENSVLRTQLMELSSRLQSVDEILTSCKALAADRSNGFSDNDYDDHNGGGMSPLLAPAWSIMAVNHHQQPITRAGLEHHGCEPPPAAHHGRLCSLVSLPLAIN